jgi:hypothetical protein
MPVAIGIAMFIRNRWGWRSRGACTVVLVTLGRAAVLILARCLPVGVWRLVRQGSRNGHQALALISFQIVALVSAAAQVRC